MTPDTPPPENPQTQEEDINLSGYLSQHKPADQTWRAVKYYREDRTPWPVRWAMKLSGGLIKNETQATYALLGFVIVAMAVAIFLTFGALKGGPKAPKVMPAEYRRQMGL